MTALIMGTGSKVSTEYGSSIPSKELAARRRSASTRPLQWQQASSEQIQVCQCKGGEQPRSVLGQAAVAHLCKAPQVLHNLKSMFAAGAGSGSNLIDVALMIAERVGARAAPVDV